MTVSEFLFLAVGLALGVASGAALIEIIRARPSARREVHLTVSQHAIPRRRAATLADDAFIAASPEPARGGPADRQGMGDAVHGDGTDPRTDVLPEDISWVAARLAGIPISAGADPMLGELRDAGRGPMRSHAMAEALAAPEAAVATADGWDRGDASPGADPTGVAISERAASTSVALLDAPDASPPEATPAHSGPCAEERRLADERCELASRAQARAAAAADALRHAQRAYDTHTAAATSAAEAINPRAVRSQKEAAQRIFHMASQASKSTDAVEAAARTWLLEINRINQEASASSLAVHREREAAATVGGTLERLSLEADAVRVGAEMAEAACLAARTAVADCDELAIAGPAAARRASPPPIEPVLSGMDRDEALGIALEVGTAPRIFRLLRGDPDTMEALVASLGGDDPAEQRRWKLALTALLDAIHADAIEQAFMRFPRDHSFWGPYTESQQRDITRALASLGHRFDGLGGWVDDRIPSQRELSLALGYAGFDPMRLRQWPSESETAELWREVEVAADEYLAGVAGDLTLAEMVEMLGRRADGLVELWNQWGRLRPLLLEEA
jgi:hypothetical protein